MASRADHSQRYGPAHRRARRAIAPAVAAGLALCARCGERIKPGERWHLGHVDGGGPHEYSGPEHVRCNCATARHAAERRRDRTSRVW